MPRFSIVIPTRQRPETLQYSLKTAIGQEYDDYEVIVQDNCSDPQTAEIVKSFDSPRILYARSDEILPMSENWERALELCSGEYITYIGDDDGLMLDACQVSEQVLQYLGEPDILAWDPHTYWWPNAIAPWRRNRLLVKLLAEQSRFVEITSRPLLQAYYQSQVHFGALPSIYSSFVSRRLIEKFKSINGKYFISVCPDVCSGIVNLWTTDKVIKIMRPLSVRGNSGKSNGTSYFYRSLGKKVRHEFERENLFQENTAYPELVGSKSNLYLTLAKEQLDIKRALFASDSEIELNYANLITAMALNINADTGSYDASMADIAAMAEKHGIQLASIRIPPKQEQTKITFQGWQYDQNKKSLNIAINCDQIGVSDIFGAVSLVHSISNSI